MDRDGKEVVEIVEVLQSYGLVTSEVSVDDFDAFGIGMFAKHHAGRVAGQDVEEEENKRHYSQ